jgi:hypothetical protein
MFRSEEMSQRTEAREQSENNKGRIGQGLGQSRGQEQGPRWGGRQRRGLRRGHRGSKCHGSILLTMASEYLYYQRSCMLTHLLMNICFMLMVFMLCLCCSHLLPAYAHLYMLMGSYVCLCMIMYAYGS